MALDKLAILDGNGVLRFVSVELLGTDPAVDAHAQVAKVAWGAADIVTPVDAGNPLPVNPGTVNLGSVPAASPTTDAISAKLACDAIMNNLTALTPKFAKANVAASSTDATLVAAVASKIILPIDIEFGSGATASTVTFNSKPAGAGTAISPTWTPGANGGRGPAFSPVGRSMKTNVGEGLSVTTGPGSTTPIALTYLEV